MLPTEQLIRQPYYFFLIKVVAMVSQEHTNLLDWQDVSHLLQAPHLLSEALGPHRVSETDYGVSFHLFRF